MLIVDKTFGRHARPDGGRQRGLPARGRLPGADGRARRGDREALPALWPAGRRRPFRRAGRKPFCGSPLVATTRGRKKIPSYVCAGHREKGKAFCTNQTVVPMAALNRAVIDSLKVTFSDQKFEQYLQDQAADAEQVAARRAERENLLLQIPTLAAAEARLAKAIAVSDDWTPWWPG